jgi:carbon starvation protein
MALAALLIAIVVFVLGYRFYASRIDREIIKTDPKRATPATMYNDGVDFMPASSSVLFGYQFKSIAALGPIVGPITGLQFGWVPAVAWVILGTFFIGWVQDYASAMLTMRNEGMTMGGLSYKLISPRARTLLLSFLYIYLLLIMGAFGAIVAPLLAGSNVPVGFIIIVLAGVLAGQMTYRWKQDLLLTTIITVAIALVGAWVGTLPIFSGTGAEGQPLGLVGWINGLVGDDAGVFYQTPYGPMLWSTFLWALVIMAFCYLGSVLPIWRFAQPVNYTSFWFVAISVVLSVLGIIIATFTGSVNTSFQIPAFVTAYQPHLGPIWPILFVTIACGAISGWHSLVSTSGTARQLEKETDALPVGGGAMYTEGVLAVLAIIMGATLIAKADGTPIYDATQNFKLLVGAGGVFVGGMSRFMNVVGIPTSLGGAVGAIFLVVMAVTIMQLVLRFMRIASAELLGDTIPALKNPHIGSVIAILLTLFLVYFGFWQWIWVLFGGSNQLFASMALMLVTLWLVRERRAFAWSFIPGLFMYLTTVAALLWTSWIALDKGFIHRAPEMTAPFVVGNLISAIFGLYMAVSAVILFIDGMRAFSEARKAAAAPAASGD